MKKTYELATLCGIDACTIVYESNENNDQQLEPYTWPQDSDRVIQTINAYKCMAEPGKKTLDLSLFFDERTKKLETQINRTRQGNIEAMRNIEDVFVEGLSIEELGEFDSTLESRLQDVKAKIEDFNFPDMNTRFEENQRQLSQYHMQRLYQDNITTSGASYSQPDLNPSNQMVMMMLNGDDYNQFSSRDLYPIFDQSLGVEDPMMGGNLKQQMPPYYPMAVQPIQYMQPPQYGYGSQMASGVFPQMQQGIFPYYNFQ